MGAAHRVRWVFRAHRLRYQLSQYAQSLAIACDHAPAAMVLLGLFTALVVGGDVAFFLSIGIALAAKLLRQRKFALLLIVGLFVPVLQDAVDRDARPIPEPVSRVQVQDVEIDRADRLLVLTVVPAPLSADVDAAPLTYKLYARSKGKGKEQQEDLRQLIGATITVDASYFPDSFLPPVTLFNRHGQADRLELSPRPRGWVQKWTRTDTPLEDSSRAEMSRAEAALVRLNRYRQILAERIQQYVPQDKSQAADVVLAITLGKRASLTSELWEVMRRAGLSHMLAISGLHMGLIAFGVFFVIRSAFLLLVPGFAQRVALSPIVAACVVPVMLVYLGISGTPVTATRAAIMVFVLGVAVLMRRRTSLGNLVSLCCLGFLAIQPQFLHMVGFQLSFAAVFAIAMTWQWFKTPPTRTRVGRYIVTPAIVSAAIIVMTLPLAALYFGGVPIYGVIGNLIGVPLLGLLVLPTSLLAVLGAMLSIDLVTPALWSVELLLRFAEMIAQRPEGLWQLWAPEPSALILLALGLIIGANIAPLRPIALAMVLSSVLLTIFATPPLVVASYQGRVIALPSLPVPLVVSERQNQYPAQRWQSYFGAEQISMRQAKTRQPATGTFTCDAAVCRLQLTTPLQRVTSVTEIVIIGRYFRQKAFLDCAAHTLVLSAIPLSDKICPGSHLRVDMTLTQTLGSISVFENRTYPDSRGGSPLTILRHFPG